MKKGNPDMVNVLDGKLMYLKMIKGENDPVYLRLQNKFEQLRATLKDPNKTTDKGITYVETLTVAEFEKKYGSQIIIVPTTEKEITNKKTDDIKSKKIIVNRYAYFQWDKAKFLVSINKSITDEELEHKKTLSISNCRDSKGKQFWLLHRSNKVLATQLKVVDLDQLNKDLESLIK